MITSDLPSMKWKCLDCGEVFNGPLNRPPSNGCPQCGSRQCFDINVDMREAQEVRTIQIFTFAGPN